MEGEEVAHSKKNSKKNRHQHASTPSKHSKSRLAPLPPSYAELYKVGTVRRGIGATGI